MVAAANHDDLCAQPEQESSERSGASALPITSQRQRARPQLRAKIVDQPHVVQRDGLSRPLSIVVVDDHRFMRDVICAMLSRQAEKYTVVGQAANAAEAMKICAHTAPELVVLDVNLPDRSGVEIVPDIKKVSPQTRVLLCTAFVSDDRIVDALRSGAEGFVEKTNSWSEFADAVDRVSKGEHYFAAHSSPLASHDRRNTAIPPNSAPSHQLSQRETEVLTLIAHGRTSKEVASDLGISVATVDTHRTNLMSKLQIRNVASLVVYAFRSGLIKLHEADGSKASTVQ